MIERRVRKLRLGEERAIDDLAYWLSRPATERLAEVERLRRVCYGMGIGLQRVARVVRRVPLKALRPSVGRVERRLD